MPKNEDGEFELILGNKQLLSMFFVVVVLLGVFFVMGYIVGRNSAPLLSAEIAKKPDVKTPVVESPAKEAPAAAENPVAATPEKPAEKAPEAAQPAPIEKAAPAPVAKAETPKAAPAPKTKAEARPAATSGQPAAGSTYLQLSATAKADADKMVEELRKNGFQAMDAEIPEKAGLFRVLVGPMTGADVNKTRADLQSKSFPGDKAIVKKF